MEESVASGVEIRPYAYLTPIMQFSTIPTMSQVGTPGDQNFNRSPKQFRARIAERCSVWAFTSRIASSCPTTMASGAVSKSAQNKPVLAASGGLSESIVCVLAQRPDITQPSIEMMLAISPLDRDRSPSCRACLST